MIKRALFLFLLGVLCVGTALAGTKRDVTFKLNGKVAGASIGTYLPGTNGGYVGFYLDPTQLPDGSNGYSADINWSEDGVHSYEIYGLLPASVVTSTGLSSPLQVNITEQSFYVEPGSPFDDSGGFISLQGTFTPYTGPDSFLDSGSGSSYYTMTHNDGSAETVKLSGTTKEENAAFEGTLVVSSGTYNLSVAGPSGAATTYSQAGSETDIITTP